MMLVNVLADLGGKREEYMKGSIPVEDKDLKKILVLNSRFIDKVERALAFSDDTLPATTKVDRIILKSQLDRIYKLRPKKNKVGDNIIGWDEIPEEMLEVSVDDEDEEKQKIGDSGYNLKFRSKAPQCFSPIMFNNSMSGEENLRIESSLDATRISS
jgi:hypothetical protein